MTVFYSPQIPTIFGPGSIEQLPDSINQLRCRKPILLYGKGTKKAGITDKIEGILKKAGIEYCVFDQCSPDPTSVLVDRIVDVAKANEVDCVIGIGGGSNLDAAKATAIMMGLYGKMREYLKPMPQLYYATVPIILIPTTAGSGSESSNASVIINEETGIKVPILVKSTLAIVDPELALTLPAFSTAITGLDALSHAVEALTSTKCNNRVEMLGQTSIRKIIQYLPEAVANGNNIKARTEMAYACNLAGFATVDAAPHLGHCMAEGFCIEKSLPHGLTCAWATPEVIEFLAPAVPEAITIIAEAMGLKKNKDDSVGVIAKKSAEFLRKFMLEIRIPTPKSYELNRTIVISNPNVENAIEMGCPVNITEEVAKTLMEKAYDNYYVS